MEGPGTRANTRTRWEHQDSDAAPLCSLTCILQGRVGGTTICLGGGDWGQCPAAQPMNGIGSSLSVKRDSRSIRSECDASLGEFYDRFWSPDHVAEQDRHNFAAFSHSLESYAWQQVGDLAGRRVLEIGAGAGADTVELARRGAEVWALDVSQRSLELVRDRAESQGVGGRVHAVLANAEQLPFEKRFFDLTFARTVLMHVEPVSRALSDLRLHVQSDTPSLHHVEDTGRNGQVVWSMRASGILSAVPAGARCGSEAAVAPF